MPATLPSVRFPASRNLRCRDESNPNSGSASRLQFYPDDLGRGRFRMVPQAHRLFCDIHHKLRCDSAFSRERLFDPG